LKADVNFESVRSVLVSTVESLLSLEPRKYMYIYARVSHALANER
jgi:hypothetical protein